MLFLRQLECPPNYTFQFWYGPLAQPIPAKKAHSSLSGANFVTLHFFFFYAVETNKLCVLVDILNRLADQLPLKSPPSNIIQINFISLSGINCTCLSVDTSLSEVLFLKQSNLYCPYCFGENLIVLFI